MDVVFRNAEGLGELEPELRMVRRAGFFVDQIVEKLTARRLVVGAGMHGGEIGRERRDVVVILAGVISERGTGEFAARPGEIKGMSEKMLRGDLAVDDLEMVVLSGGGEEARTFFEAPLL